MREASIHWKRAGRVSLRACVAALLLATAGTLGGCAGSGATSGAYAMATPDAQTIAFESIDGPPPNVFDRMVGVLDSESKLRNLAVVSREGQAAYRVRSYLAAQVIKGRTVVAWVWDVYDRDQQRTLRLSGEEPTGKSGRDAWANVDDLVLRKIAQAGFSGLTGMVGTPPDATSPASPAPGKTGPAVAEVEQAPAPGNDGIKALSYAEH
jgi:hypothetical protein